MIDAQPAHQGRLSRRSFLLSGVILASCKGHVSSPGGKAPPKMAVADAHLHIFNASDLPIAGFLKHVYLPNLMPDWPAWGDALVDMFAHFYQPLAITAQDELTRVVSRKTGAEPDAKSFAAQAARFVDQKVSDRAAGPLADSYTALVGEIADARGADRSAASNQRILQDAFNAVAKAAESDSSELDAERNAGPSALLRVIGWGYLMVQSRRSHLYKYATRFGSADATPTRLFSLLVDYDLWLDDGPARGSDHLDQLAVQRAIAVEAGPSVDLRLFAGYCPLRHAIERSKGGPTRFDKLVEMHRKGGITGYKIYPPMGFRAWGNADLADHAFDPQPDRRRTALARWREVSAQPLGPALDDALAIFYRRCAEDGVPIVAHAGSGNGAGPLFGLRADPLYWEQVVRRFPVRLSLGHLVNEAKPFVDAVDSHTLYPPGVWALHASLRMLDRRPADAPDVYGDLAYMPELIGDPDFTRRFFIALRTVFAPGDPDLTRILFGSDWIMMGLEAGNAQFLGAVETGMNAAGYSARQRHNILFDNAQRFLSRRTGSTGVRT